MATARRSGHRAWIGHRRLEVKTKGIEFQVYDNKDAFLGDCIVSKFGLTWCKGKTKRENGKKLKWRDFINSMQDDA